MHGCGAQGARWWVPFEDVRRYQFASSSQIATDSTVAAYSEIARRFDRPLAVEAHPEARAASLELIRAGRVAAGEWLDAEGLVSVDAIERMAVREGDTRSCRLLRAYLAKRDLLEMDADFSQAFVSNPDAGELVKGHAIVLAELGLCRYAGKAVRSPRLFTEAFTKQRRATHILTRLAFTQALWSRAVPLGAPLYRAIASDGALDQRTASSFVSATFSADIAIDHFRGGPTTRAAAILRQSTPVERLFMTFLETPAMSRQFKEAEAILIGDPASPMF
jgi:hypothetical protein